jgi:hypothetical protein
MSPALFHWLAALLLVAMASFAWNEARSEALITRSLFLWPLSGFLFGLLILITPLVGTLHSEDKVRFAVLGAVFCACSVQAFLSNIRRVARWPSGAIWLALVIAGLMFQPPSESLEFEPFFLAFYRRFSGLIWAAIGIAKVAGEKGLTPQGGMPAWLRLLYLQAILIASAPY